ncbi:hypothetical protein HJFPF1_12384 [Paramyrothecium foliicola]|nr:hypothetical protein HJFPF1_12384 [Paramyrothecium foliicola]
MSREDQDAGTNLGVANKDGFLGSNKKVSARFLDLKIFYLLDNTFPPTFTITSFSLVYFNIPWPLHQSTKKTIHHNESFILFISSFIAGSMAAYNPNEHLALVNCGPGILSGGEVAYYRVTNYNATHNPSGGAGNWAQPNLTAELPKDGSFPWRREGHCLNA